jgi:hypothetical protein
LSCERRPSFLTSTAAGSSSIGISKSATTRSGRFCVTATGRSGELAYYEGYRRFAEVFGILRERYGPRLAEVRPTPASGIYLYGDEFSARATIDALNASLTGG